MRINGLFLVGIWTEIVMFDSKLPLCDIPEGNWTSLVFSYTPFKVLNGKKKSTSRKNTEEEIMASAASRYCLVGVEGWFLSRQRADSWEEPSRAAGFTLRLCPWRNSLESGERDGGIMGQCASALLFCLMIHPRACWEGSATICKLSKGTRVLVISLSLFYITISYFIIANLLLFSYLFSFHICVHDCKIEFSRNSFSSPSASVSCQSCFSFLILF